MKGIRQFFGGLAGLMACMTMSLYCPAQATAAFHDNGNGTVTDLNTNLMWQQSEDESTRTWQEALDYCEELTFPSREYSDWRVPNVRELESIVDWDRYDPAIDTAYFPECRWSQYWSSSTHTHDSEYSHDSEYAWYVNFATGLVAEDIKLNDKFVRCVRDGHVSLVHLEIKANDSDGPITVYSCDRVSIDISLNPGDKAGQNADWWIAVHAPFTPPLDWYTYVYPTGWVLGINLCVQARLFDLSPHEVLNMTLPIGNYIFYFAIDDPDGTAIGPWWGMDSVEVTVQ